jgi:cell division protein FtsW
VTIAMRPSSATRPDSDVRARRQAALERLNGGGRAKPSRRAVQTKQVLPAEQLGPPPAVYYVILVTVVVFVLLGLVMVMSATSAKQVGGATSPYSIFGRQAMWAGLGVVGMFVAVKVPYRRWRPFVIPGAVLAAGGMMLPFVPGVGATINDATSWVRFGSFGFQPSEFLKLAAIAFLADMFARNQQDLHIPSRGMYPLALVTFGCAGASFMQGDLGSAIVLASVILAVGMIAGVPIIHVSTISMFGVFCAAIAIMSSPRRFNRLVSFRDVEANKEDLAWQSWQGLVSIANGGMTGSGVGGSNSKLGYLPLAHSDFIFAVIADELGFIGSVAVIGGFALLVWFGIQTALAAPDQFGIILAGGISVWFGVQAFVNMGGVVNLIPVTGLTLPFFSAGGTSLFVSMIAAGLLLNVARRAVTTPRRTARTR